MKAIVSVLAESPFYFTMNLRDRYVLVKRLVSRQRSEEPGLDLTRYELKVNEFLKIDD